MMCLKSETSFFIRNCQKKISRLAKTTKIFKEISKIFSKSAFHQFWLGIKKSKCTKASKQVEKCILNEKKMHFRMKIKMFQ